MAIKISDLKPKESLITELSDRDTKKIHGGGGGVETGGTGATARVVRVSTFGRFGVFG